MSQLKISSNDIPEGTGKIIKSEEKEIAIFNVNGEYFAIENICTHQGGPLGEGDIDGEVVTCPWHGAKFNIKTGEMLGPPARGNVSCYNVRVIGPDIEIEF